jgi:DNA-binding Lrp family transcriptional regulator
LLCIAREPGLSLREIGDRVGITERAAHRIVAELEESGYLTRERNGRRNRYTIAPDLPVPDSIARERQIGDLLDVLADQPSATPRPGP